jgi:aspartate/methionine/tyrosine aminotransferase
MKNIITRKISTMPNSIFSTMSSMALEYKAVNLGQGFPDFDAPRWIIDEAYRAMESGKNQYAPSSGTKSLKNAIKDTYKKFYDININTETDITVTAGATEALCSGA